MELPHLLLAANLINLRLLSWESPLVWSPIVLSLYEEVELLLFKSCIKKLVQFQFYIIFPRKEWKVVSTTRKYLKCNTMYLLNY